MLRNYTGIYAQVDDEVSKRNLQNAYAYVPYICQDARSYVSAMKNEDYNKAVSEAEQVAEKSMKAMANKKGNISNTLEHKHKLVNIQEQCGVCTDIAKDELKQLEEGYFKGRYPNGKIYSREDAINCGNTAFAIMDKAIEDLDISQSEINKEFGEPKDVKSANDLNMFNRIMREIEGNKIDI